MPVRQTYRVQAAAAPRLVFELSRRGQSVGTTTEPVLHLEREHYDVEDASVAIDHVAALGWFCVISGEDTTAVESLAGRLGLDPAAREERGYAALLGAGVATETPSQRSVTPGLPRARSDRVLLILLLGLAVAVALDPIAGAVAVSLLLIAEWLLGRAGRVAERPAG